jgi:hypothetical protein
MFWQWVIPVLPKLVEELSGAPFFVAAALLICALIVVLRTTRTHATAGEP